MNVLLTGATGFIGREVLRQLLTRREWTRLVCLSRAKTDGLEAVPRERGLSWWRVDLTDPQEVSAVGCSFRPDLVIHLAGVSSSRERGPSLTAANAMATHNLLNLCDGSVARFVYASSATVYGDRCLAHEESPVSPTSPYGASKAAGEMMVGAFDRLGLVSGVSLRMVASAGRGATHGVVKDVVSKLLSPSPELELWGDGPGSLKPMLHVGDTARAVLHFAFDSAHRGPVNVATGGQLTSLEVAEACMHVTGIHKPVRWNPGLAPGGDNAVVRVSTGLATSLGWSALYQSDEAVVVAAAENLKEMSVNC